MLSMSAATAHLALYDTLADWEVGHVLVELRMGRFTGAFWDIVTVAESHEPITTMGGLRILPDALLDGLDPAGSNLLILPGGDMWDAGGGNAFAAAATAGPQSPVQFACATLRRLGLASDRTLAAYEDLFHRAEPTAFPVLMQARNAA